jgi:hypothetical protein
MRRFLLIWVFAIISTSAVAQSRCVVTDPTGTPLNVRSRPNGAILGALHNGIVVRVTERDFDQQGRAWVYVVPQQGRAGWVFREFVSCY